MSRPDDTAHARPWWLLIPLLLLAGCGLASTPRPSASAVQGTFRLATFNVHFIDLDRADGPWSLGAWQRRRVSLDRAFKSLDADIVALQEANAAARSGHRRRPGPQRAWLSSRNPGYGVVGGDSDGTPPYAQPVFYRTARFDALDGGWFQFSPRPGDPTSAGLGDTEPAHASWARLRDRRNGRTLTLLNVHFHHRRRAPQDHAARLVAAFAAPLIARGEAVLLAGDLNVRLASPPVATMRAAGLRFLPTRETTYHFNRGVNVLGAIDHIAHGPDFTALGPPRIHRDRFDGLWPSDHYPVSAALAWTSTTKGPR